MDLSAVVDLLLLALLLGIVTVFLSSTAGRLDRVHRRIETAAAALDAQLLRRANLASEVAESGLLDPAASMAVLDAARSAVVDPLDSAARSAAESELTRLLTEAFPSDTERDELLEDASEPDVRLVAELAAACRRVELARRFHNAAVAASRELRRRRSVRWFRLAGHTPYQETVELADTPPPGLADYWGSPT